MDFELLRGIAERFNPRLASRLGHLKPPSNDRPASPSTEVFVVLEDVEYEEPSEVRGVFLTQDEADRFAKELPNSRVEWWEVTPASPSTEAP